MIPVEKQNRIYLEYPFVEISEKGIFFEKAVYSGF